MYMVFFNTYVGTFYTYRGNVEDNESSSKWHETLMKPFNESQLWCYDEC